MDREFSKFSISENDRLLNLTVIKLWQRVDRTHQLLQTLREILKEYKKHRTCYQTLAELGIYMNKPGFNRLKTQELVTFFCEQAS